jgi:hypothetical protein
MPRDMVTMRAPLVPGATGETPYFAPMMRISSYFAVGICLPSSALLNPCPQVTSLVHRHAYKNAKTSLPYQEVAFAHACGGEETFHPQNLKMTALLICSQAAYALGSVTFRNL